jgi:rhodanese-related sulfurtransferase
MGIRSSRNGGANPAPTCRPGGVDVLLAAARARLDRVPPERLDAERHSGALIVDIRPLEQRARDGELPGAVVVERNALEWRLDPLCDHRIPEVSGHDDRIVLVCNEGYGSSLAAAALHDIGLHRATDLIGGFQAWSGLYGHDRHAASTATATRSADRRS